MISYNLKAGLLKYNLIFYISEDFNEEYFTSLEDKRYFFKKRIQESIKELFNTNAYVKNIEIKDDKIAINLDSGDFIEVTNITPTKLELSLSSINFFHKFTFVGV